ncbi:hypothetical protein [Brevundimonas sp.]|uniref:hypothetical protein n=1 Tax=Brevundimonas sp. TaxID=1871086 RepID=UPI0011FC7D99|nr:hypothetical protein [Brevundimonas sp.]TAJ55539.1 MAG: hypothetical protein EPO49_15985 [Brevundimonas sp.]
MTPRLLSKTFVVIYWIALPLFGLIAVGGALGAGFADPPVASLWTAPALGAGISALIIWRLVLHHRALAATRQITDADLELFSDAQESEKTK